MQSLIAVNYGFVFCFGTVLALSFADIGFKNNKKQYVLLLGILGIVQIAAYFAFGEEFLFKNYPFLTHLPLFLTLKYFFKKNTYVSAISVLSAYLFCTPRKWIGTFASYFWNYNEGVSYLAQIIITIPSILIVTKYISPYVSRLKFEDDKVLKLFVSVPLVYYVLEYGFTVYTDLLYQGGAVIVEFMDAAVVIVYFVFSIIYLKTLYEKKEIEVAQASLKIIANQSKTELESLRKFQDLAVIYRHDLRHHLNYLNLCISHNKLEDAAKYIEETCGEMDNTRIVQYSEDESINLIVSAYVAKADEKNIKSDIKILATDFSRFIISDLCSLLSNALENAIGACERIEDSDKRYMMLRLFSKNNKLCIDICNSYHTEPVFTLGIPVSPEKGHGFGTKSMAYIVEKYNGLYRFSVTNGLFVFQATL